MEMAHGTTKDFTPHLGLCLTDDETAAIDYAVYDAHDDGTPVVHWIDIDLTGLTVTEVAGYDTVNNQAAGDDDEHYDADVIVFDDETIRGRAHRTWRIVSQRALAAVELLCTEEAE